MLHHLDEIRKSKFQKNVLQVLEGIEEFERVKIDCGRTDYVQAINNGFWVHARNANETSESSTKLNEGLQKSQINTINFDRELRS